MKKPPIHRIGLTGGIASGKSTVTAMLRELGATVIDTDAIAKDVVAPGELAWQKIRDHYGIQAITVEGYLDRAWVGRRIFGDAKEKEWIEALLHPIIRKRAEKMAALAASAGERAVVFDVPLLFESGWEADMDEIWTVYVPGDLQAERLQRRDALGSDEIRLRIASQWPIDRKAEQADRVIQNEGSLDETRRQVEMAWKQVLEKCGAP